MTEHGQVAQGDTQIGKVRRPLAAVSKITKNGNIAFFSEGSDWIISKKDPIASQILELVERAQAKTKVHEHKGTYRMRAWLIPENQKSKPAPFGRQGAP